jgi:hypothetical protein
MKASRNKNNQKTYFKTCLVVVYIVAILLIFSVLNNPDFSKGIPGGVGVGKNAINPAGIMTGLGNGMPSGMGVGKNATNPAGIMTGLGNQNNFQGQGIINNVASGQNWTVPNGLGNNITNNMGSVFSENGCDITFEDQEAFIGQQGSNIIVKLNPGSAWIMVKQNANRNNKCFLASGDIFSEALTHSGLAAASLEVPDPIGAKGPNPTHGGTHAKKGDGNPGGGNNIGRWGQGNQGNGLGNILVGNQGKGVGEGMAGGTKGQNAPGGGIYSNSVSDPGSEIDPRGANDPTDERGEVEDSTDLSAPLVPLQIAMIEGCPTIQPCQACATLIETIAILRDEDGSRMAALQQIFSELAPAEAPFSPEMAATIAMAFADAAEGSQYESVIEYIDAFVRYVSVLDTELGSPVGDSVAFVMGKHGAGIMASYNANIGAFIATRLEGW